MTTGTKVWLTTEWVFTFGKYKGKTLGEVSALPPGKHGYVWWCFHNIPWFKAAINDNPALKNTLIQRFRWRQRKWDEHLAASAYTGRYFAKF